MANVDGDQVHPAGSGRWNTRSRIDPRCLAGLGLALSLGGGAPALGAEETPELPRHQLVFARHSDAARTDYDLWRVCADGTQLASLVTAPGDQIQVAVSPDGTRLAWAGSEDGPRDVWRRSFAPGEAVNLTDHPADDSGPVWSPGGDRLAFFSTRDHDKPELYLMDPDGGRVERLTDNAFHDSGGVWAPDGGSIVLTRYFPGESDHGGAGEVIALDLASGQERQLTSLGGYNGGLAFSPDGETIAFHRTADGRAELWLMAADGGNPRPITDTFIDEYSPEFSPDGGWLAFTAGTGNDSHGTFDLWLMRLDGSRRQVVSRAANTEAWAVWRTGDHFCR